MPTEEQGREIARLYEAVLPPYRAQMARLHAIESILAEIICHLSEQSCDPDLVDRLLSIVQEDPAEPRELDPESVFVDTYGRVRALCEVKSDDSPDLNVNRP